MIIETGRLMIRKITWHDLDDLYRICGDPELMKYVGDGHPLSREQTQKWIEVTLNNYASKGFGMYGVIYKETGAFIGYCGLVFSTDVNDHELIYALSKAVWGRGLATEIATGLVEFAFSSLDMKHLYASIDPENSASERILLRTGFTEVFRKNDEHGLETTYYLIQRK